jgi:GNAT superfamily N-acetyltransferase
MVAFQIRELNGIDRAWVARLLEERWGSTRIVTRGRIHHAETLPGFVAAQEDKRIGLLTYCIEGEECEIVSLNSLVERIGVGSALIAAAKNTAVSAHCKRLWLITTNDNLAAMRFYQKRGFVLVAVHRNALAESRRLKPEIPLIGIDDIPLRDEIELEMELVCEQSTGMGS